MAQRPPRDLDWIPDNSTGINVPSQTKQNAGWLIEKPARQFFNWLWNRLSRWVHYNSGQSQEFIVIDSTNANEKDYDTLAAYIAAAPAAGDKVLVKETQVLTAQMVIPDDITLRLLDGITFTRSTDEANSVIKFGSDIIIEGIMNLFLSHTGTTAKALEFDGDNVIGKINVENSSTGILTTVHHVNADKIGNSIDGFIDSTGGGSIVNGVIEATIGNTNHFMIIDKTINQIKRSRGAFTFQEIVFPENWTFVSQVGNDLNIAGIIAPAIAALNGTDIAYIDGQNDDLRTYRFDGADWAQVGNDLNIPGFTFSAITALNETDIGFIDDSNADLRVYRFNGTDWAQVGNDLSLTTVGDPALAALNGTDVAFIDDLSNDLKTYRFDGADWAQVGNDLNIASVGKPALTALNGTDVAFIDDSNDDLRTYRFDGADWAQVGNDLNIASVGKGSLAALNGTDVAFIDLTNDDLRIYRFDGVDWLQVGNELNIAGATFLSLAAMSGNEVAFIDDVNEDLRLYRWNFATGKPHNL